MLLLLIRHADAGVPDPGRWPDDADRPLTEAGRATQRIMSRRVVDAGISPVVVVSSPFLRARQTAEILADVCHVVAPLVIADALVGPPTLAPISEMLAPLATKPAIALMGHELNWLASQLLVGTSDGLRAAFVKSAVMAIRLDAIAPGEGELVAFLYP